MRMVLRTIDRFCHGIPDVTSRILRSCADGQTGELYQAEQNYSATYRLFEDRIRRMDRRTSSG